MPDRSMTRLTAISSVLSAILGVGILFGVGAWFLRDTAIPSPDSIRDHAALNPFLIEPQDIEGIYANLDIVAVVFSYRTSVPSEAFWAQVQTNATPTGWRHLSGDKEQRIYQKKGPGKVALCTRFEEARIARVGTTAIVALVQVETPSTVEPFEATKASAFAAKHVWPKYAQTVQRAKTNIR